MLLAAGFLRLSFFSSSSPQGPYVVPDITRDALMAVVVFLYSGRINLTVANVQASGAAHPKERERACPSGED